MINKNGHTPEQVAALATWHGGDDIRNMVWQLFNETGEIAKHVHKSEYKPGHVIDPVELNEEFGDAFYYLLIITASYGITPDRIKATHPYGTGGFIDNVNKIVAQHSLPYCLSQMGRSAANLWHIVENVAAGSGGVYTWGDIYPVEDLRRWLVYFEAAMPLASVEHKEMVAWNQRKLAGGNNHGWKPALPSIGDVAVLCNVCDWAGTVAQAEPDVDGDGGLGCPQCGCLVDVSSSNVKSS